MRRTPDQRIMRWMSAGAYTVRHWRGILLGMWLATLTVFGLIAWWGYANREDGVGAFTFTLFGFIVLMMLIRFPRRLVRSARDARAMARRQQPSVIDTDATVHDRIERERPTLGPRRDPHP